MLINTEQMISMSEANQNFSKVARMAVSYTHLTLPTICSV